MHEIKDIESIRKELIKWKQNKGMKIVDIKARLKLDGMGLKTIERVFNEEYNAPKDNILKVYEDYKKFKTIQKNNEKASILNKQLVETKQAIALAQQEMLSIKNEIEIYRQSKQKEPKIYILEEEVKQIAREYEFYDDVECMSDINYKDKKLWGNIIDKKVLMDNEEDESEVIIFMKANNKYIVCILNEGGKYWVEKNNTIEDVIETLIYNLNGKFTAKDVGSIVEEIRLELEVI